MRGLQKAENCVFRDVDKKVFTEEFATTTNLIGSLLAVNIVSPIIRNKFGADIQKAFIKKQDKTNKPQINYASKNPVFTNFSSGLKI